MENSSAAITEAVGNHWILGSIREYRFAAELYDEPLQFSINEGRVLKLHIWKKGSPLVIPIASYDQGWVWHPETCIEKELFEAVMDCLENAPKGVY